MARSVVARGFSRVQLERNRTTGCSDLVQVPCEEFSGSGALESFVSKFLEVKKDESEGRYDRGAGLLYF